MTDSQQLLADYRQHGSDAAFRELVNCFVGLVYSTALRLVGGDTHQAEDVTQTVFVDLARQARTLPADVRLGGWLHRHTCFVAANTLRGERRRQARERQAVEMNVLQNHPEADFSQVAPLLDEAINELADADRTAILLRFFERQDFRAVGAALGSTEDAARMRVTRALERLEQFLKRRGVKTTAASLGVVLTANAIQAVPAGLAAKISAATLLAGTITTTTIATMNWLNAKAVATIVASALAAGTATYFVQQGEVNRLRAENQNLLAKQEQTAGEREAASAAANEDRQELERLRKNQTELLRLRGEVGALRRQAQELDRLREENRRLQMAQRGTRGSAQMGETDEGDIPERRVAVAKMGDARQLVLALRMYAEDNQNLFPSDLSHASNYWGNAENLLTKTNQFELVIQGSVRGVTNPATTIVIREKEPSFVGGRWVKTYGFVDGHSEFKKEPPEGFEAWEKQHMIQPPTGP